MPHADASGPPKDEISRELQDQCQSTKTVSALLAEDPSLSPGEAWKKLYKHSIPHFRETPNPDVANIGRGAVADDELEKARRCGRWGESEPSKLFLRLWRDALCTVDDNVGRGMVSPPLMGSTGVVPLTIISVVPDIVKHMANLIVRAEQEVFLATNFWQNGVASSYITNAIKELSRRAGVRGTRVTVKVLYDRGSVKQLFEPHFLVSEREYTGQAVGLPAQHDIPHVDLEVMNYHNPLLGTMHAKFMIVDRTIGVVQSNNIQDNDNLEMLVQVEGPVVQSLLDMALLSWHRKLDPQLPSISRPEKAMPPQYPSFALGDYASMFNAGGVLAGSAVVVDPAKILPREAPYGTLADKLRDGSSPSAPADSKLNPQGVSQEPQTDHSSDSKPDSDVFEYDSDLTGEVRRTLASLSPNPEHTAMQAVSKLLSHTTCADFKGDAPDFLQEDAMTPLVLHPPHSPFPIALVNRPPYAPPNHKAVANPQNAAWLSALRNAEKNVFIQSPTLNAEPLVPAIIEACERGIDVYCYICLGYNDSGELLPMQGGHNEMVAAYLHEHLSEAGRRRLHYYWYVAKDNTRPIAAERKQRSCHIKLMIVDERIAIQGSGNQDTQSWYQSQECNIMLESPGVCRTWIDALRRNQNTHRYGALQPDGVWRDDAGHEVEGAIGVDPGRFSWARGFVGAIKRLQGTGGF